MSLRECLLGFALCLAGAALPACGPAIDVKQAVQVTDVSTGWFDAGIQDGKNKLVPSVTFRLRKNGDVNISSVSINLVFKIEGSQDHFDDVYVQRVEFNGAETPLTTVRSNVGYTGDPPQSRADMLKNSQFRDMDAQIFAKHSSAQWAELHHVKIARQLLTH